MVFPVFASAPGRLLSIRFNSDLVMEVVLVKVHKRARQDFRRAALALFFLSFIVYGQAQQQSPSSQHQDAPKQGKSPAQGKEGVVRISVTLVQVDAGVTDQKGRPVTDLRAEDFRISEDGRPQQITNFSYVAAEDAAQPLPSGPPSRPLSKNAPPPPAPTAQLRPDQVLRRTIALVVDDLGLSFQSTIRVRDALKKFVDEQIQSGDFVAIVRTGAGMGALQQFTADKRLLYAAIERVQWNPSGRAGISAFAALETNPMGDVGPGASQAMMGHKSGNRMSPNETPPGQPTGDSRGGAEQIEQFRDEIYSVGTLGALNFVVRGLRSLPGRKSVVLFSDGFPLVTEDAVDQRVLDSLHRLVDLANRASVVVYTIDARGLQSLMLSAADDIRAKARVVEQQLENRQADYFNSQEGLSYLAQETGGFFARNSNDIGGQIKRVLDDQKGYYLIGYVPERASFTAEHGRRKFHKVSLTVTRPGLRVRSRTGFYGVEDEETHAAPPTREGQLMAALSSPFGSGDVRLRLTSLFAEDPKTGSFVRSLLHIDARDLTFSQTAEGSHKAAVDVVAVTFGEDGNIIQRESREYRIAVPDSEFERTLEQGLLYTVNVPIKKPGAYQLRCAARDVATQRVGSANQFIETPDLSKRRLALSGLVLEADLPVVNLAAGRSAAGNPAGDKQTGAAPSTQETLSGPAVRHFHEGSNVKYGFYVYNAKLDPAAKAPRLKAQVLIFQDGRPVFAGESRAIGGGTQIDPRRVGAGGRLGLGAGLAPGDYVLQIVVTDELAPAKHRTTSQWVDFEIHK